MKNTFSFVLMFLLMAPVVHAASMTDLQAALMQEDYAQAREISAELLKGSPKKEERHRIYYYEGLSHLRLGAHAQAQDSFEQAMKSSADPVLFEEAWSGAIDALYLQGLYEDCVKEALAFIKKRPSSELLSSVYLRCARAYLKLAQWSKAHELLNKVIETYPESFESQNARQLLEEKRYFAVQVGAFTEKERARMLSIELLRQGHYAYIVEKTPTTGKNMYHVRVGQMSALADAQVLEQELASRGYPTLIYP